MNNFKLLKFGIVLIVGIIIVFFAMVPSIMRIKNLENTVLIQQNLVLEQQEISRKLNIEVESLKYFTTNGYKNKRIQDMKGGDIGWTYGVLIMGDSVYIKHSTLISNKYSSENPIMVVKKSNRFIVDLIYVDKSEIEDRKHSWHSSKDKYWTSFRYLYINVILLETR